MKFSKALAAISCAALCSRAVAMAMDMDMDMDMEDAARSGSGSAAAAATTSDLSQITPVPHEPKHLHGQPILDTQLTPAERLYWESYNTTTFFTTSLGNRRAFWYHCFSLAATTLVAYPASLVLRSVRSNWYLPALCVHVALVVSSLIALSVFASSFPESWYPGSVYPKLSLAVLIATLVHFGAAVITQAARWVAGDDELDAYFGTDFIPLHDFDAGAGEPAPIGSPAIGGAEGAASVASPTTATATLFDAAAKPHDADDPKGKYRDDSNSFELGDGFPRDFEQRAEDSAGMALRHKSRTSTRRDHFLGKVFAQPLVKAAADKFGRVFAVVYSALNYPLLLLLAADCVTGFAVGNLLGKGLRVFNLLAHWIKGGVFVVLGVVSLARYCGFGVARGWAWNKSIVFKNQIESGSWVGRVMPHGTVTMEGIESALIFLYGSTNVFLEHLSNQDGKWAAKDLQHVSIAFMYIGCGLCGLIAEHKLSDWRFNHVLTHTHISPEVIHAGSPGYSPNPFPAFTIFWTGILMSQHAQASATSTTIHVQWGYLLSYGSFFRLITFVLLMLVPNKNLNPSRPFTELVTSFCLLCGGLIFMESTDQVVEALEFRGFTSMFTFNLSVGFTALFMAWEMMLFLWLDWLKERRNKL